MIFQNKQPLTFIVESLEVGYTKMRVLHNVPVDEDIHSRSIWRKAQGALKNTATREDVGFTGRSELILESFTASTAYDLGFALVDEYVSGDSALIDEQYTGTETVLSITEQLNILTKTPASISSAVNINNDQEQIGAPPSTLRLTFSGEATNAVVEASTDNWVSSQVIYVGRILSGDVLDVTLGAGTYKLRTTSTHTFADGTTDPAGTITYGSDVAVSDSIVPPEDPSSITVAAVKILDNVATYNLTVDWNWVIGSGGQKQNTLVSLMEFDGVVSDLSTLDWTNARSEVSLGLDHTFTGVPYRKNLALRVQTQGWNNNSSNAVYREVFISENNTAPDNLETGFVLAVDGEALPAETKVYIDNRYIQGFNLSGGKTFEFDAATGNVTIGTAGTYHGEAVTVPFQFDATNSILSIAGQVITNEIVAADYVMGWLGGDTPQFRTANKTGYADANDGIWMGYSDANTFQVDIGNASQYIRWDGSNLRISGSVIIDGGSALDQLQKNVMIYKAATSTPATPTGGTYASPVPAGWSTSIPSLAANENAYMSQRLFTSDAQAPQDAVWTAPGLFTTGGGEPGTPGADGPRGAGTYYHSAPGLSAWSDSAANNAVPSGTPVLDDIVSMYDSNDPALYYETRRYNGSAWVAFTLQVHGDALVRGTVQADRVVVIDGASGASVTIDPAADMIINAFASGRTIFGISKTGGGILDGKAINDRSIDSNTFSEEAQNWIINAVGATSASGGLVSFNDSVLVPGTTPQVSLTGLVHKSGNPTTVNCRVYKTAYFESASATPPTAPTVTITLKRDGVAIPGKTVTATASVSSEQEPGPIPTWIHAVTWDETIAEFTEDLPDGTYVYSLDITSSNGFGDPTFFSMNAVYSADEQVVSEGVDLTDYAHKTNANTFTGENIFTQGVELDNASVNERGLILWSAGAGSGRRVINRFSGNDALWGVYTGSAWEGYLRVGSGYPDGPNWNNGSVSYTLMSTKGGTWGGNHDFTATVDFNGGYRAYLGADPGVDTARSYNWTGYTTTTDTGTLPTNYLSIANFYCGSSASRQFQIAAAFSSANDGFYIRRSSDNAGSENGASAWQNWKQLATYEGANNFSGVNIFLANNSLKLRGTSTGDSNVCYLPFYESNGTTRQGYVGLGSSGADDVQVAADTGNVDLYCNNGKPRTYVSGSYYDILHTGTFLAMPFISGSVSNDANTAGDASGFSVKYLSSTALNAPTGTDHAIQTNSFSTVWQTQMASDWRTNKWYVRTQESGTWKSWSEIATLGVAHTWTAKQTFVNLVSLTTEVQGTNPFLKIKDTNSTGDGQTGWISFQDSTDTEKAYIGFGSTSNSYLHVVNSGNPVWISGSSVQLKGGVVMDTAVYHNSSDGHNRFYFYSNSYTIIKGAGSADATLIAGFRDTRNVNVATIDGQGIIRGTHIYPLNTGTSAIGSGSNYFANMASQNYSAVAGNGQGLRFWNSDSYKIYMSTTADGTWGGALTSGTDYNMYFRMTGNNRGFVFDNETNGLLFHISALGHTSSRDIKVDKNNPWLTLDSSSSGGSGTDQGAGISIGESGYKGSASVHLAYTGDGYGHLGMGVVDGTSGIMQYRVLRMHYQSQNATFYGIVYAPTFASTSATRYKNIERVVGIDESLRKVCEIGSKGVKVGRYKDPLEHGKGLKRWMLAEDFVGVIDEPVTRNDKGEVEGLDYVGMVPDLFAAIAALEQRVRELENNGN